MNRQTSSSPAGRAIWLLEMAGILILIAVLSLVIALPKTQNVLMVSAPGAGAAQAAAASVKAVFNGFKFLLASPSEALRAGALWGFFCLPLVLGLRRRWLPQ